MSHGAAGRTRPLWQKPFRAVFQQPVDEKLLQAAANVDSLDPRPKMKHVTRFGILVSTGWLSILLIVVLTATANCCVEVDEEMGIDKTGAVGRINKIKDNNGMVWIYSKPSRAYFLETEVTVSQYLSCVRKGGCNYDFDNKSAFLRDHYLCNINYRSRGNHPMNCVDLNQADEFCEWIGGNIPTSTQWYSEFWNKINYKRRRIYPWGNEKPGCERAVLSLGLPGLKTFESFGCGKGTTWPVCSKPKGKSISGLCDMCGNVAEWVVDQTKRRKWWRAYWAGGFFVSEGCFCGFNERRKDSKDEIVGFRCVKKKEKGEQYE